MIYYDKFETWEQSFRTLVSDLVGDEVINSLSSSHFNYIEDAGDFIVSRSNITAVSSAIHAWLLAHEFCVFHGTRLLSEEVVTMQQKGLLPLKASDREPRFRKILSGHPMWQSAVDRIPEIIDALGPKNQSGKREGQVHFSLSRSGLVNSFNHYLKYGSEFDQHVVLKLFSDNSGLELLRSQTVPYLIHVKMSGDHLIQGAHPIWSYFDVLDQGEVPGVARTFLNAWAFKTMKPSFDIDSLRTDCCMMQTTSTPPERIALIEKLNDLIED